MVCILILSSCPNNYDALTNWVHHDYVDGCGGIIKDLGKNWILLVIRKQGGLQKWTRIQKDRSKINGNLLEIDAHAEARYCK